MTEPSKVERTVEWVKNNVGNQKIVINRVPKNTFDRFIQFASVDEFCQDYGMALKFLLDFYCGIIPSGIEHIELELISLKEEINLIKNVKEKDEKKRPIIRTLGGKEIKVNKNDE